MDNYFVIGDIHGRLDMMVSILRDWKPDKERLVLLGDYIDCGPDAYSVVREVKNLVDKYGAIALKGNHEEYFVDMMLRKDSTVNHKKTWKQSGRDETFKSFLKNNYHDSLQFDEARTLLLSTHASSIEFMNNLPAYHETDSFIMAHAGVNLSIDDWTRDVTAMKVGNRSDFFRTATRTGKIIVFGHSRTGVIRGMDKGVKKSTLYNMPFLDDRIWIDQSGTKIGLDGGIAYGGLLHGIHIGEDTEHIKATSINQNSDMKHSYFDLDREFKRLIV